MEIINIKRKKTHFDMLYVVACIEGAALMAIELLGAKLIAPYYGNSLYVWTAVLATTLGGLALGYLFGGILSEKYPTSKMVGIVILASAFVVGLMPYIGSAVAASTLGFDLRIGVSIAALIILTLPVLLFGMVSPMIINLLTIQSSMNRNAAGPVYAISTFGGVVSTFLVGFYFIPDFGVKISLFILSGALALAAILCFIKR